MGKAQEASLGDQGHMAFADNFLKIKVFRLPASISDPAGEQGVNNSQSHCFFFFGL